MTLLVTSIAPARLGELKARAEDAWALGADAVEVRIDTFEDDPAGLAAYLKARDDCTWIVTCRSRAEGGDFAGNLAERVSLLVAAASETNAYVDFELADWRRSRDLQESVRLAAARTDGEGHRLVLSAHDFSVGSAPRTVAGDGPQNGPYSAIVEELLGEDDATAGKIAYQSNHINDSFDALDLMHQHGGRLAAICMGEDGLWSRVLARKFGAFASYCSLSPDSETAPGQLTLADMMHRYYWGTIDASTRVFGVLGDPVGHSMSPALFNRWFADANVNAVYLPLRVRRADDSLPRFLDACVRRPWLDVGGFSVTLPHKTDALDWVGPGADHLAARIGALNTLVFRDDRALGYNTDCHAAIDSIVHALGCERGDLNGLPADVLGSGGAARAILAGLRNFGCEVTLFGRSPEKSSALAERFDARATPWEQRAGRRGEILINCTSVGMWPSVKESPMPQGSLSGCRLVFDVIYNPLETKLLKQPASAGAVALGGLDMFIRQAAMQFELWTARKPDTRLARELITREIQSRTSRPS
jgi:3-dehydroquinate dehydratase/shikimate dehydrogenase